MEVTMSRKTRREPPAPKRAPAAVVPTAISTTNRRIQLFDLARGVAIVLMVAYHFCFDLNYYGLSHFNFNYDPFWLDFRAGILSLFLGLVGISLVLASGHGFQPRPYFRRLAWLAGGAALVSVASRALFPQSWIFFGVLHFILLASLLGLLFLRFRWLNLALGALLLLIGLTLNHPLFDQPWLNWIGLMTHKPITEDYVPLLPWFGVVLIGMFLGREFACGEFGKRLAARRDDRAGARWLALAGRHGLLIYLVHQPLLLGLLWGVTTLTGVG
jgi:uncharacterized membrane protein